MRILYPPGSLALAFHRFHAPPKIMSDPIEPHPVHISSIKYPLAKFVDLIYRIDEQAVMSNGLALHYDVG